MPLSLISLQNGAMQLMRFSLSIHMRYSVDGAFLIHPNPHPVTAEAGDDGPPIPKDD